jgi:hypothetical protein
MGMGRLRQKTLVWILVAAGVVIAGLALLVVILVVKNDGKTDTTAATQRILKKVGEIYMLPGSENPTVAELRDPKKLAGQEFFKNAAVGDYLLVYPKAELALLYRESTGKLVKVGPVTLPAQSDTNQQAQQ